MALSLFPVAIVLAVVLMPFERPARRSPGDVVRRLCEFRKGCGDWDDFISTAIADPRLEDIRQRAETLDVPLADKDVAALDALIAEAEAIAVWERLR